MNGCPRPKNRSVVPLSLLNNIVHKNYEQNLFDFFLVVFIYLSSHGVVYSFSELLRRRSLLINGVYL